MHDHGKVLLNKSQGFKSQRTTIEMEQRRSFWQQMQHLRTSGMSIFVRMLRPAFQRYGEIGGEQCAASFAYYAFFSLFPLILLLVAISTCFIQDRERAARRVVTQIEQYTPFQDKAVLLNTVDGVLRNGWRAGLVGFITLTWSSLRFLQALVIGINRAWGLADYRWWHLPLKNLMMTAILVSSLILNILLPLLFKGRNRFMSLDLKVIVGIFTGIFPAIILFCGLTMFYKFAPRRPPPLTQVWAAALFATLVLTLGHLLFEWYLSRFAHFNALYGVFGAIMALQLWIYIAGAIIIFGGCIAATGHSHLRPGPARSIDRRQI